MRAIIGAFLFFFVSQAGAEVIAHLRAGSDLIQVHDQPCDETKTAGIIEMNRGGTMYRGCWRSTGTTLIIKWDDGDEDQIPHVLFTVGPAPVSHNLPVTQPRKWDGA